MKKILELEEQMEALKQKIEQEKENQKKSIIEEKQRKKEIFLERMRKGREAAKARKEALAASITLPQQPKTTSEMLTKHLRPGKIRYNKNDTMEVFNPKCLEKEGKK